jgi:hypothetical protein
MRTFLALIASLGLVACVGGIDSPPADDTGDDNGGVGGGGSGSAAIEARKLFDDNVRPVIAAKCVACHSVAGPVGNITGFVDTNVATAYATATGYQAVVGDWTASAPIITKLSTGSHANGVKGADVVYSPDDITKITAWLNKELEARAGGGPGPGPGMESAAEATVRLTKEWSGCMTLTNFTAANMKAWGNVNAGGGGDCKTCHYNGEYGNIAENQDQPFFDTISQDKYYMAQYFSVDLSGGVATAKVIVNMRSFTGVGTGLAPHQSHPRFDPANNNGMAALTQFYDLTMTAKTAAPAGVCGPPKLLN